MVGPLVGFVLVDRRGNAEQPAGEREVVPARGTRQQAIVPDAVEAAWQDMKQEALDERIGAEGHDALAFGFGAAIILIAEGDAAFVEGEKAAVRDGDPVCVARKIGQHRLRSREGRLGIDYPSLSAQRGEMSHKGAPFSQRGKGSEEVELSAVIEPQQSVEEQAAEERAQHPHG